MLLRISIVPIRLTLAGLLLLCSIGSCHARSYVPCPTGCDNPKALLAFCERHLLAPASHLHHQLSRGTLSVPSVRGVAVYCTPDSFHCFCNLSDDLLLAIGATLNSTSTREANDSNFIYSHNQSFIVSENKTVSSSLFRRKNESQASTENETSAERNNVEDDSKNATTPESSYPSPHAFLSINRTRLLDFGVTIHRVELSTSLGRALKRGENSTSKIHEPLYTIFNQSHPGEIHRAPFPERNPSGRSSPQAMCLLPEPSSRFGFTEPYCTSRTLQCPENCDMAMQDFALDCTDTLTSKEGVSRDQCFSVLLHTSNSTALPNFSNETEHNISSSSSFHFSCSRCDGTMIAYDWATGSPKQTPLCDISISRTIRSQCPIQCQRSPHACCPSFDSFFTHPSTKTTTLFSPVSSPFSSSPFSNNNTKIDKIPNNLSHPFFSLSTSPQSTSSPLPPLSHPFTPSSLSFSSLSFSSLSSPSSALSSPNHTNPCPCHFHPTLGYWRGPNCSECALGYKGANCTSPPSRVRTTARLILRSLATITMVTPLVGCLVVFVFISSLRRRWTYDRTPPESSAPTSFRNYFIEGTFRDKRIPERPEKSRGLAYERDRARKEG